MDTLPMIAMRTLLKSWAMPPASSPSDASLPAFARSSWIRSASVMSRNARTIPIVRPSASQRDAALSSMGCSDRSRATRIVQRPAPVRLRALDQRSRTELSQGWRVSGSKFRNTAESGCPDRLLLRPAGQLLRDAVDRQDGAVEIGRDHAVARCFAASRRGALSLSRAPVRRGTPAAARRPPPDAAVVFPRRGAAARRDGSGTVGRSGRSDRRGASISSASPLPAARDDDRSDCANSRRRP